jgi:endoglucanase
MRSIRRLPAALPWLWAAFLAGCLHPAAAETADIRLNTLGYFPDAPKRATVVGPAGAAFRVVREGDSAAAYAGSLTAASLDTETQQQVAVADFTSVRGAGTYCLEVDGVGESAWFRVDNQVYRDPFRTVMRGFYLWRCGTAVSGEHRGQTFSHAACHLEDGYLDFVGGGHVRRASVGGWHDAGDYNKYVVNAGATVGVMLRAWEDFGSRIERVPLDLPKTAPALPEFLAEVKWETDWLLTMQADDGSVYHKLSTQRFGPMIVPEEEAADRYFVPASTNATADFVAMLAQASRHFAAYDRVYADRCLAAARKSYEYLIAHPERVPADQRGFTTGRYETDDWDDRLWAEAELWEATGDANVLAAFESRLRAAGEARASDSTARRRRGGRGRSPEFDVDWDWNNLKNLGLFTYVVSTRPGRDAELVATVRAGLIAAADRIVAASRAHAYARPLGSRYYWGCNGTVARQTMTLEAASRLTGDAAYRAVSLDALNHLFGRNPYGRSYVTGLGHRPPLHPHDRRSAGDDVAEPWPGYLVGGPNPRAGNWRDEQEDYRTNEIAINWNGALVYALASQLGDD